MPFVEIDRQTYRRVSEFAETTGTDVRQAVCDALGEWMDTTGDTLLDFIAPTDYAASSQYRHNER